MEILLRQNEGFMAGHYPSPEEFYREQERYLTIEEFLTLEAEDMEENDDQASVG